MNKKTTVIIGVIILLILGIFIIVRVNKKTIDTLDYDEINETITNNAYSIIYYGNRLDEVTQNLEDFSEYSKINVYYGDASLDELNESLSTNSLSAEKLEVYVLYIGSKPYYVMETGLAYSDYLEQIDKYFFGIIPTSEIKYINNISDVDTYIKKVNSKKYTITVLGSTSCHYCTIYKNVFNKVAGDYGLEIYYFDAETYDEDSYQKILDLDLTIPAECTQDNTETTTKENKFAKPMTLITKSGKTVDCIKGEVNEATLIEKLKKYDIISSEE